MKFNYFQICQSLLKDLPQRQKEVVSRRFGLKNNQRETLEFIGENYGITRERVRQVEKESLERIKPKAKHSQKIFQYFKKYLKNNGELKKEEVLLTELGGENQKSQIYFLLTLGEDFERIGETDEFYPFWTINQKSLTLAKKIINSFFHKLKTVQKPLPLKAFNPSPSLSQDALISYLEISKKIQQDPEGLFGLREWPEINPRGIKDRAFLVFQKAQNPLHFSEVAKLIPGSLVQTVHNELIKDPRFVLVGRGIYALKIWGYQPGPVKDVISEVLKEEKKPLTKEEILDKVQKQRLVKENTVLLNLSNKKYFLRDSQGKYIIKES